MARRVWLADDGSEHKSRNAAEKREAQGALRAWFTEAAIASVVASDAQLVIDSIISRINEDPFGFREVVRKVVPLWNVPAPAKPRQDAPPPPKSAQAGKPAKWQIRTDTGETLPLASWARLRHIPYQTAYAHMRKAYANSGETGQITHENLVFDSLR